MPICYLIPVCGNAYSVSASSGMFIMPICYRIPVCGNAYRIHGFFDVGHLSFILWSTDNQRHHFEILPQSSTLHCLK